VISQPWRGGGRTPPTASLPPVGNRCDSADVESAQLNRTSESSRWPLHVGPQGSSLVGRPSDVVRVTREALKPITERFRADW
jgi:hypothetical protein